MPSQDLIQRKTELSDNVIAFCRYLRTHGLPIGPQEQADSLSALSQVNFSNPDRFRLALRSVLARSLSHQRLFDKLYPEYWKLLARAVDSKIKPGDPELEVKKEPRSSPHAPSIQSIKSWLHGSHSDEEAEMATYSPLEVLTQKDFSNMTDSEIGELTKVITVLSKSMANQRSRRFKAGGNRDFDIRKTIRSNLRQGGEIISLFHRQAKRIRPNLVLLCDVSKSMDLYSVFLIQFMYAFQIAFSKIETFVFSTSQQRITQQLKNHDFQQAMADLGETVDHWSGGTKIGECFNSFLDQHEYRMLNRRTVVLILSDGWDTGDVKLLEESVKRIRRRVGKVIWLNPLAGSANYRPDVRGMQAALPFVDVFAPGHNLESLRQLVHHLKTGTSDHRRKR